jgi:hypothetical protein
MARGASRSATAAAADLQGALSGSPQSVVAAGQKGRPKALALRAKNRGPGGKSRNRVGADVRKHENHHKDTIGSRWYGG